MNQTAIGSYIARKRKEQNLTQEQLAQQLGVSNKTISKWENGVSHTTFYCSPRFQGYALLVHCVSLNTSYYSHSVYCYYSFDRI